MLRLYRNSVDTGLGLIEYSQVYNCDPRVPTVEREEYEPVYKLDGKPISRQEVSATLSVEKLAELVDSAREDKNWRPPGPDEFY